MLKGKMALAYAAGIIDGEGCIYIEHAWSKKRRYRYPFLNVSVRNTNEWICQWFKIQFGGVVYPFTPRNPKWKVTWHWALSGHKAQEFLKLLLPYLQMKRPQAELAIQFSIRPIGSNIAYTDEEIALREAQRILMGTYNQRGRKYEEKVR